LNNCSENNNTKNNLIGDKDLKVIMTNFLYDFELLDIICQGNNISLYKCIYKKNKINKNFVIKFIKKNKKKRKYESKEIDTHRKLKHCNIINLIGYYDLQSYSAIISDFQKYGDLHQFQISFLKKRILSETFLCYLTGQILEAIQYIHKNKILHLDIKQKNILVNDFMQFKLIDFSISIDYKNKDYINLPLAGTFGYMSPEVLNRKKIKAKDASKIDIFSFGVLLYFSAFGTYPYDLGDLNDKEYDKMTENIEKNELKFPEGINVSNKFKSFLQKCLEKNINKRYHIHNIFNDDWVKGGEIIKEYKEKLCNTNIFLIDVISDHILEYNKYVE
jgi:serine/threonine protein kinase